MGLSDAEEGANGERTSIRRRLSAMPGQDTERPTLIVE